MQRKLGIFTSALLGSITAVLTRETYLPAFNAEFARPPREEGSAFVACGNAERLDEILCEHHERVVGHDNCVHFRRKVLQIPSDRYRCHYVKATVKVLQYPDG